ncbi:PAS domain S-box-containing protein [Desulfocicer vacuolatum DSM 3385]|uniref:histidine kinase n=1 Tax=Desulfocicer vacuolatum DSM 3385 TaxID=1121400 RepID=A0A1W1YMY0_9BACT|nr:ATP-binding protein [Desulfocicer vacuolatum]SMC37482.1 PAS domain S-box-containing protein [Desulfocicer vacuolatum DSM 3385]
MIFPYMPILAIDVLGSLGMICIAGVSLSKARKLRAKEPDNAICLYLVWICSGLTIFALSRAFGHILKQVLLLTSHGHIWSAIGPYSGTINTVSFMLVGLVTLFFNQSWTINTKILSSRRALEETHSQLVSLNQTLEQKVVERTEMLTTSEHKCRRIFEQSLDTILVTDDHWHIREINPAGVAMTGYTKEELLMENMPMDRLFASDEDWQRISRLIMENEFILNEETYFKGVRGNKLYVIITGGIDYGAFGCAKTFHFIIKNINEKKEMEEQIVQADKLAALGELSAGVAHEINNPLGIILGYTQLMLKAEAANKDNFPYHDDLKIIEKHVKNCKTVVSDMLAFARKDTLERGIININQVLTDVVNFIHNHADFRNITIELNLFDNFPLNIMGNEQELRQVIINLLINACHALDKKGNISVSTRKNRSDEAVIVVKDNGKGISPENITRIFHPFFTTKPVGQGTGLGLSVSYGIIKKHGGRIQAESEKNKGATFTITVPLPPEKGDY